MQIKNSVLVRWLAAIKVEHSRLQVSCLFYSTLLCLFYLKFNCIHFLVKQRLHNLEHGTVSQCRVGEATCSPTRLFMLSCASFVCKASQVLLLNYAFLHTCKYIYIWESVNIPMCEKLCFCESWLHIIQVKYFEKKKNKL